MRLIEKSFNKEVHIHSRLKDKNICFLDIETTGLNKFIDTIYLIGLLYFDKDAGYWKVTQLFAEELVEEVDILLKSYNILSEFDLIANYNGTSFDIPFINNKLNYYKTNLSIDIDLSLDIYKIVKVNRSILPLKNLKLKSIEEYLGIYREDKYTGKDCINFYFDYLITKNKLAEENILQHNFFDLYYLLDIMELLNIIENKKSLIINYKNHNSRFYIDEIHLNKDFLFIYGNIKDNSLGDIIYFADSYKAIITKEKAFEVSIEVEKGLITPTQECLFIKSSDYSLTNEKYQDYGFNVPKGLILLGVEKKYYIDNIKIVMSELIEGILC